MQLLYRCGIDTALAHSVHIENGYQEPGSEMQILYQPSWHERCLTKSVPDELAHSVHTENSYQLRMVIN